jgi:hypothetical protein
MNKNYDNEPGSFSNESDQISDFYVDDEMSKITGRG